MGHGCHDCGCPNMCICDELEEKRKVVQKLSWTEVKTQPANNVAVGKIINEVWEELNNATAKFGSFNSAHEGWAVAKEEVDELWDEVKAKQGARDVAKMRKEAVQCAAMFIRFILDVCDSDKGQK